MTKLENPEGSCRKRAGNSIGLCLSRRLSLVTKVPSILIVSKLKHELLTTFGSSPKFKEDVSDSAPKQIEIIVVAPDVTQRVDLLVHKEQERKMADSDYCVWLRGLPWDVTMNEIMEFLDGCSVKGGTGGVHFLVAKKAKLVGEAFVELQTEKDLNNALKKDKERIRHRYIEVFKTTRSGMSRELERSVVDVKNIANQCCVRLQGLPFDCSKEDICNLFSGLYIVSNGITFVTDISGRNTGAAYVKFTSKEMVPEALSRHGAKIGNRYVEIILSTLAEVEAVTRPAEPMDWLESTNL